MDARPYLALFVSEARRRLALAVEALPLLEGLNPEKAIGHIEVQVHTLKGMAAQMDFPALTTLAHTLEDVTRTAKANNTGSDAATVDLLREGLERLGSMIDLAEAGQEAEPAVDLEQAVLAHLRRSGTTTFTIMDAPSRPEVPAEPSRPRDDEVFAAVAELLSVSQRLRSLEVTPELAAEARRLETTTRRLFGLLARARQVSFDTLLPTIRRHLRGVCREKGKEVELEVSGEQALVDPGVLGELQGALVQLVNNAVVHAIESPGERRKKGKPRVGKLRLVVEREQEHLIVTFSDDGQGFDLVAIERARRRGREDESTEIGEHTRPSITASGRRAPRSTTGGDLDPTIEIAFLPGVSTATDTSTLAGRGQGLGIIRQTVENLGGTLKVDTTRGRGSRFRMEVPVQQRIEELLLVREDGATRAILARSLLGTPTGQVLRFRDGHSRRVDGVIGTVEGLVSPPPFPFNLLPQVNGTTVGPDGSILFVMEPSVSPALSSGASA